MSVEVEGWGDLVGGVWGGLAESYSITVFRSSTGQSTQSPPEGKRLNKPGRVSVSPPASAVSTMSVPLHLLLLLLLAAKSGLVTRDDAAAALQ